MIKETMTSRERFEAAVNLQEVDRTPIGPAIITLPARYYGMTMEEYYSDAERAMGIVHRFFDEVGGWDVIMAGPLVDSFPIAAVMPLKVKLPGKELPPDAINQFDESEPVIFVEDYDTIIERGWNHFFIRHLMPRVRPGYGGNVFGMIKAGLKIRTLLKLMKRDYRYWDEKGIPNLIGGMSAPPFEMLSVGRTIYEFSLDLYRRPEKVIAVMDAMLPGIIDSAISGAKDLGVPRIFIGATRGSSGMISPEQFERFYFPWLKRMVEAYDRSGNVAILHFDSDWTGHFERFLELPKGRCILQLDSASDIFKAKEILGDHMCIMGDVPATLLKLGTPEEVEEYCKELIDKIGEGGGFILSAGCEVPHDGKYENVKAMIDTGKSYYPH